jgi:hypothetical protein
MEERSMGVWFWKDCLDLRPQIAAETHGFHRGQDHGDLENPGGFGERHVVVDDRLAVKIGHAKEHPGLEIDNRHHAVVRSQQTFFASSLNGSWFET